MPTVSSKVNIAKQHQAPPKKIEQEDEEIVPVHKKNKKKLHKKHKDDGAPKSGAEKDMYKSLKKKDASTSDLQGYASDQLGEMSDKVAGKHVDRLGNRADKYQSEQEKEDDFDKKMDLQAKSQWYTGEEWLKPKPTPGKLCYNATDPLDQVNPLDATLTPCKPKKLAPAADAKPMVNKMKASHMMRMKPINGQIEEDDGEEQRPSYARSGAFLHRMRPSTRQFVQIDQQVEIDQPKSDKIEINFVQENVNLDEDEKSDTQETEVSNENAELIMQQTDNI